MCKLFFDNETVIKEYCENNRLDFEKVKDSWKSWNKKHAYILRPEEDGDEELARQELAGLIPPEPLPVTLKIFDTSDGLVFEQTEYTAKYLSL